MQFEAHHEKIKSERCATISRRYARGSRLTEYKGICGRSKLDVVVRILVIRSKYNAV